MLRPNLYSEFPLMDQAEISLHRTRSELTIFGLLPFPALILHFLTNMNKLLALESLPQDLLLRNPVYRPRLGIMVGRWVGTSGLSTALPKTQRISRDRCQTLQLLNKVPNWVILTKYSPCERDDILYLHINVIVSTQCCTHIF